MRIAVCDDESYYCEIIQHSIKEYFSKRGEEAEIVGYTKAELLLMDQPSQYDAFFLDIEMPQMDGIQLAKKIGQMMIDSRIVFISSHREWVKEGYKVRAYRYLFKPIEVEELTEVMDALLSELADLRGIFITSDNQKKYVYFREIIKIEAVGDWTAIHTEQQYYFINQSLKKMEMKLDERFFRCHHRFVVNLDKVTTILCDKKCVVLEDGTNVPFSVRRKRMLQEKYLLNAQKRSRW